MPGQATHQAAILGALGMGNTTIEAITGALPIHRDAIYKACGRLVARGLVERLEIGTYQLTAEGTRTLAQDLPLRSGPHRGHRKHPVAADSLQQRAWRAMRLSGRFTIGDVAALARHDDERGVEATLQRWFHRLTLAGYLVALPTRAEGGGPGFKQWRLLRNTGDAAPMFRAASKSFVDRNTRKVFPCV